MNSPHATALHRRSNRFPGADLADATARSICAARPKRAFNGNYFTLYAGFSSTKKQGLRLAFGVRAGTSAVRNKAKRLARETFRLNRHKFPGNIEIVISAKKDIGALNRRDIRGQIHDLLERACTSPLLRSPDAAPTQ